jgi:hypothetical protein
MHRYCGFQLFEFGVQKPAKNRKGEDIMLADHALTIACKWEVVKGEFRLSSADFEPVRHDEHAAEFYELMETDPLVIESLEINQRGVIRIGFHDGHVLTVTPGRSKKWEHWRYMPRGDEKGHLVLEAGRIGWSEGDG